MTLTNDSERALDVNLDANFGALIKSSDNGGKGGALGAGERKSLFFPLDVTGTGGKSTCTLRPRPAA